MKQILDYRRRKEWLVGWDIVKKRSARQRNSMWEGSSLLPTNVTSAGLDFQGTLWSGRAGWRQLEGCNLIMRFMHLILANRSPGLF